MNVLDHLTKNYVTKKFSVTQFFVRCIELEVRPGKAVLRSD